MKPARFLGQVGLGRVGKFLEALLIADICGKAVVEMRCCASTARQTVGNSGAAQARARWAST